MPRDLAQLLQDLERRKSDIVAQLLPHQQHIRRNIFATIRAGLASQLHALLQLKLYRVDERDYNGCTPLHIAAHEGRQEMVAVLLAGGSDPMAKDNIGRTPRDLAVSNRHAHIASYLLEAMKRQTLSATKAIPPQGSEGGSFASDPLTAPPEMPQFLPSRDQEVSLHEIPPSSSDTVTMSFSINEQQLVDPTAVPSNSEDEREDNNGRFSQYSTISDNVSLVICMVGLPGRGKSFISKRIARYLNWKGVPCRVFNAGNYRRQLLGAHETAHADFYDPNNKHAKEQREVMAQLACEDLVKFLASNTVAVGVLDATNTTVERREHLIQYFSEQQQGTLHKPVRVLFIESVCTDESIITENILRAKCGNDDFKNVDAATVVGEFRDRIKQYEKVYESIQATENVAFIKIVNIREHIVLSRIPGGLPSRIVFFLLNLHPVAFPLFVTTNSQTEGNRAFVFGGSGRLTERGRRSAMGLKAFVMERCDEFNDGKFIVLHGTNPQVEATIAPLRELADRGCIQLIPTRCLDDINYGRMNGDTMAEGMQKHPKRSKILFQSSAATVAAGSALPFQEIRRMPPSPSYPVPTFNYQVQFPGGESCRQVNLRLESALMHIMRCGCPVLVVAPDVPAQGVVAFFSDLQPELSPVLQLPRHHVIEISKGGIQLSDLVPSTET